MVLRGCPPCWNCLVLRGVPILLELAGVEVAVTVPGAAWLG
jgi:hypothetical protein